MKWTNDGEPMSVEDALVVKKLLEQAEKERHVKLARAIAWTYAAEMRRAIQACVQCKQYENLYSLLAHS